MARAHRKVRASRADFLHRTSARLVRDHDVIVIEDLAVQNMVRNRSLAKAISDCGWGTFRQMLAYKAARAERHLIVIGRWYPSSKKPKPPRTTSPPITPTVTAHNHQRHQAGRGPGGVLGV